MQAYHELAMEIAAFRFSVTFDFVNGGGLLYGQKLFQEKSNKSYKIPTPELEYPFPP